ncbi:MAG: hypothetical protein KBD25_00805 [Rickettsiaceae bacterium]|nr:hypothetical protein [Rickettsiaceae bacterium]
MLLRNFIILKDIKNIIPDPTNAGKKKSFATKPTSIENANMKFNAPKMPSASVALFFAQAKRHISLAIFS